jgi:uncharacterized protein (DUF1778 family)
MRDAAINLRALPEQRELIDHAANLLGKIVLILCLKPLVTRRRL